MDYDASSWRPSRNNCCYVMPDPPGALVPIVVPSALQMGWAESPAYFCAGTETGRDLINLLLRERIDLPEHPLERFMAPTDSPKTLLPDQEYTLVGVYVDDFLSSAWSKMTPGPYSGESRGQHCMLSMQYSHRQWYRDMRAARIQYPARSLRRVMRSSTSRRKP
jgi:hypothetical protein